MRNWTSTPAFRIARVLFYYRLVGVVAFELFDSRVLLLLFPNTFEFFFIAYEGLRTRWDPERWSGRFFAYLTTLIVVLYDTYRPFRAARVASGRRS